MKKSLNFAEIKICDDCMVLDPVHITEDLTYPNIIYYCMS